MCGICGIFHLDPERRAERSALADMNQAIVHRGPDDDGFFVSGNVGLAMRRLSIIDVQAGHQPISNEDETIWIVYNGEIYNHQQLRSDLIARGHRYRTRSDTESIVHLYEEYGEDCVQHLRGMFAFVLWDGRKKGLFAARDRLGIKPFYYRFDGSTLLFGSEIKALLAYPGVKADLNPAKLPEYLAFGYLAGEGTLFSGIKKLLPGHTLAVGPNNQVEIRRYWDLQVQTDQEARPQSFYVQRYREMLEEAVASHLMSEVPLGVFLSGGLDSSVVAALTTKICRGPIKTFAVGHTEERFSELPYARAAANHLGSEHHEVLVSRQEFLDSLPHLIWQEDEPIVWPSSVSLYFVAQLARQHVTVVLTGEGSDETLGGYARYGWTLSNKRLDNLYRTVVPSLVRRWVKNKIGSADTNATLRRRLEHTFLLRDGASWTEFYFDNFYSAFSGIEQVQLLSDEVQARADDAYAGSWKHWNDSSGDLLHRLLYTDIKTYLVELLMKQDNMSMAASIESRVPFLDHVLVEFAASIPSSYSIRGLAGKRILKQAVADLLPPSIIYRRKMGFPTPWPAWLRGDHLDYLEHLVTEPRSLERGLFRLQALRQLFAEHRSGRRDNGDRIWRLLNLELWHRVFIDQEPVPLLAGVPAQSFVGGSSA